MKESRYYRSTYSLGSDRIKNMMLMVSCLFISFVAGAQSMIGAWERYHLSETGEQLKSVVIFAEGYQVISTYEATTGKFIDTNGGSWQLNGDTITEKIEFDTKNPERVGSEVSFQIYFKDSLMGIVGRDMELKRIDSGTPGKLKGAWLMSGRTRNGQMQERDVTRPRKTMKVLSGTRFQWIAYNTDTKQFMGTGGGTYTTINGKYTENIEFFSRDDSRVGMSLDFDYNLVDGKWHHKGLSSKGDPIHEVWSIRKK